MHNSNNYKMLVMVNNNHSDDLRKFEKQIITNSAIGDTVDRDILPVKYFACKFLA